MIQVVFVSQDGQTAKITQYIVECLQEKYIDVDLHNISNDQDFSLPPQVTHVVLGVPIRYGKPMPQAKIWLEKNVDELQNKMLSAFSVNLTARKPDKSTVDTCPYSKKLIAILPKPADHLAIFAGALDYARYSWFDRNMIRFIMWLTHGPTRSESRIEYTCWQDVDAFVERLAGVK